MQHLVHRRDERERHVLLAPPRGRRADPSRSPWAGSLRATRSDTRRASSPSRRRSRAPCRAASLRPSSRRRGAPDGALSTLAIASVTRDAGARPVLRDRAGREVDVQVASPELLSRRRRARLTRERTNEYAASTDSRITSPSWPVTVSLPVPGMRSASIVMMSPPVDVHASPVTAPTSGSFSASSAA